MLSFPRKSLDVAFDFALKIFQIADHIHIVGAEQISRLSNLLDLAVNSVGAAGQEVHNAASHSLVYIFHIHNNSLLAAQIVGSLGSVVIVNMENVDKAMARRVVDFLSGCAYALDGKVKKVAQSTYLFCPHNMEVIGDLESLQNEAESYI